MNLRICPPDENKHISRTSSNSKTRSIGINSIARKELFRFVNKIEEKIL